MKLEVYGNSKNGYFAHLNWEEGENEPLSPCAEHVDLGLVLVLEPCPFCGSRVLRCENSHTPRYSVTCEACGVEGPNGRTKWPQRLRPKAAVIAQHKQAIINAVDAWNRRA